MTEPEVVEGTAEEQPEINGVLVTKQRSDDGTIDIDVQVLGSTEATEAPTILELAVKTVRAQFGLTA